MKRLLYILALLAFTLTAEAGPKTECPMCQKQGVESTIAGRTQLIAFSRTDRSASGKRIEATFTCSRGHWWSEKVKADKTETTNGKLAKQ